MSKVLTLYQKILIVKWYYKSNDEYSEVIALFEEYFKFTPILAVFNQVIKAFELTGSVVDDVICAIKEEPATDAYPEVIYIKEENEDVEYFESNPEVSMKEEPIEEEPFEEDESASVTDEPITDLNDNHSVPKTTVSNNISRTVKVILPEKSREVYETTYMKYQEWKFDHKIEHTDEKVLMRYFDGPLKECTAGTMWSIFSKLKSTISLNENNVDLAKYSKLKAMLKRRQSRDIIKRSKTLSTNNVEQFLKDADDDKYLLVKVALIMGIVGALRRTDLKNLSMDDIEEYAEGIEVRITYTRGHFVRKFIISNHPFRGVGMLDIVNKYRGLRPSKIEHKKFFIGYRQGKCTVQAVGLNCFGSMPKQIAEFLHLPSPNRYTGQCFRRSSKLFLSECSLLVRERHIDEKTHAKSSHGGTTDSTMDNQS